MQPVTLFGTHALACRLVHGIIFRRALVGKQRNRGVRRQVRRTNGTDNHHTGTIRLALSQQRINKWTELEYETK